MFPVSVPIWEIVLRTVVVFVAVYALLRLAGKRELGQMSSVDLVVILIIANAVQNSLNGGDTSLLGGLVSAATLVALTRFVDRFGRRLRFLSRVVEEKPTLLMKAGVVLEGNLESENIDTKEIEMAAREKGFADLSDVDTAILEVDGSISIIPKTGDRISRTRRIRQFRRQP